MLTILGAFEDAKNRVEQNNSLHKTYYLKEKVYAYNGLGKLTYRFFTLREAKYVGSDTYILDEINLSDDSIKSSVKLTREDALELANNSNFYVSKELFEQQKALAEAKQLVGIKE